MEIYHFQWRWPYAAITSHRTPTQHHFNDIHMKFHNAIPLNLQYFEHKSKSRKLFHNSQLEKYSIFLDRIYLPYFLALNASRPFQRIPSPHRTYNHKNHLFGCRKRGIWYSQSRNLIISGSMVVYIVCKRKNFVFLAKII